ncbi:MAG: hypothetical protein K0Q63_2869, partial [Paenibacillus sp.]|nr:hypothetical protein [Paenibacillus sp.]
MLVIMVVAVSMAVRVVRIMFVAMT